MYATAAVGDPGNSGDLSPTWFVDPDSFNLKNFVGDESRVLHADRLAEDADRAGHGSRYFHHLGAGAVDYRCAIVGNIKKGQAAVAIWGWWVVVTILLKVLPAMFS